MNAFNNYAQNQGYNQGAFPNGVAYGQSYAYGAPQARPLMTDPLTGEERKLLANHEDLFDLKVTPQELAYAVCAHKRDNNFDIIPDGQGNVTCRTCGATFRPDDVDEQYVQEATDRMMNVLQTIKMLGVDLNSDVFRQYFSMIPYIKRVPKLFKAVNKSFQKYTEGSPVQPIGGGQNVYDMFNSIMNPAMPIGGYYPQYGYAQPGMQYGYGQPGAPMMGQPVTPFTAQQGQMVNGGQSPFYAQPGMQYGYGQPGMQGAPMMNQPTDPNAQSQQAQNQPAQQQAPAAAPEAKVNQQVQL